MGLNHDARCRTKHIGARGYDCLFGPFNVELDYQKLPFGVLSEKAMKRHRGCRLAPSPFPWERQMAPSSVDLPQFFADFPKLLEEVCGVLFAL